MIMPKGKQALWHLDHYKGPWGVAVDIGAYHGDFALAVAEKGCEVLAYEPNVDNFDMLLQNIEGKTINAINAAVVGNPNGAWVLEGQGNTTRVRHGSSSRYVGTIGLVSILQAPHIDLLKIDIEGGEHEMFAQHYRLELKPLLQRVRFLQIEIHPPDGFTSDAGEYAEAIEDLVAFFARCGFRDEPCPVRAMYAGDFCSNNHEFIRGRPE